MSNGAAKKHELFRGKFLGLVREGHWEYTYRVNATGAAIILAVTPESKVLLAEQYRIPCHARTIELPAGIIGDEPKWGAESQAEAARRELLEETGYEAAEIRTLMTGPASSGLTSELVTLFLASNLRKLHKGGGVDHEEILVHEIPLATLDEWLSQRSAEGFLIDPKIYAALYFLRQHKEQA
jgi:ADP-ribose pyrophosphatase